MPRADTQKQRHARVRMLLQQAQSLLTDGATESAEQRAADLITTAAALLGGDQQTRCAMTARVSEDPAGLVAVLMVLQASMAAVGMVATVAALAPAVRAAQLELLCMLDTSRPRGPQGVHRG